MVDILAESPHVRDHIVDLFLRQQIPKSRHNLREPTRWPPMHDHCLPIAVRLRRRPGAIREIRPRIRPQEHRARCGSTLALAAVTRNATTLVDLLPIPHIRTLRIVERLCGKKQMATKKHEKAHDQCARRSRQKPRGESAYSRFTDGLHRQSSSRVATL